MTIGALLPWERLVSPGCGYTPGCFGGAGQSTYLFSGSEVANGRAALFAGLLMALAGLAMIAYPAAQRWCPFVLAAALVVAASAAGGWWLKPVQGATVTAGAMELAGVLLGLAAVPLCLPGPARKRAAVLAAAILLCVVGVALARPMSGLDAVVSAQGGPHPLLTPPPQTPPSP